MNSNISLKPVGSYNQVLVNVNAPMEFQNPIFGKITVYMDNYNNPWFMGKEVCGILSYKVSDQAIRRYVSDSNKIIIKVVFPLQIEGEILRGNPNMYFINERGLYELIRHSRMQYAIDFGY